MIPIEMIQEFINFLKIPFIGLNVVDIAIVFVIIIYAFEGYAVGFIRGTADFISFIISFIFGLTFYNIFSLILVSSFQIPSGIANSLGFFIGAFICEVSFILIFRFVIMPAITEKSGKADFPKVISRIAGIFPGILSSIILLAFVLTMIVSLPISPYLKNLVEKSRLGEPLVLSIQGFDKEINNIFGGAVNDALTFLTVEPKSEDLLKLNFQVRNTKIDEEAEEEMLELLNGEREKGGLGKLSKDLNLKETARKHCTDMLERGYFSHYSPEGRSPFDRMNEDNIEFKYAGENLALAPSVKLAMQGLMRSPGHRANILNKNFGKAGIGVIDGGIYGEMFCQEFTD